MSLEVSNLNFSYGQRQILFDVSFSIEDGNLLCLLGPNGVGKSTLFKTILGILPNYTGDIVIDGQNTKNLSREKMARYIAYIPQSNAPTFNYSVFDMVLMGTNARLGAFGKPGLKEREQVEENLEKMGIAHLRNSGFAKISGGERQLALIARALVQDAKVMIMDEPTANLDYGNQIRVLEQVKKLAEEGCTIIQATHQPDQAFLFADQVLALKNGRVMAFGTPNQVIDTKFVEDLYRVKVDVQSLYEDKMRVCVPIQALRRK